MSGELDEANAPTERPVSPGIQTRASEPVLATGSTRPATDAVAAARGDDLAFVPVEPTFYAVGKELARGGMGRVLVARDRRLGRTVAIKELLVDDAAMRARFEREARITARLQHPSTVAIIEAGLWPGGEPFFAMNLVVGEPLERVIAGCRTFEARLGLIPNVIAAADALAYAHDRRIIHRDLKPANVLIGRFGQTIVVDWGLAKDLTSAVDELASAARPSRNALETVVGTVMGTPAYMPPEQAKGDPVDERADVYALGAMLYHVLSGLPPYRGTSADAVLDAVLAGPPRSVASLESAIPPELVTIVEKAMARDPAQRYATAAELVRELKDFQTGQIVGSHRYSPSELVRRFLRRHKAAVAAISIATIVVAVIAVISVLRIIDAREHAEAERKLAVQRRADADRLLDFMLYTLKDKLEPIGKLELLGAVAGQANEYYQQRTANTPSSRRQQFQAWLNLGDVLVARGDTTGALAQYRKALATAARTLLIDPQETKTRLDLADAWERIGSSLLTHGDNAQAGAALDMYMHMLTQLADESPADADIQARLAKGNDTQAALAIATGRTPDALARLQEALAIQERRIAAVPHDDVARHDLIGHRIHLGDLHVKTGSLGRAITEYRAAVRDADQLDASSEHDPRWWEAQLVAHNKLGEALQRGGDIAGSAAEHQAAVALGERLTASDPTNANYQRLLVVCYDLAGNVLARQGKRDEALARLRAASALARHVVELDPKNVASKRSLSVSHVRIGRVLVAAGDLAGAQREFESALRLATEIADADPKNTNRKRDVAITSSEMGDLLLARKDRAGALVRYRTSLAVFEQLASMDPQDEQLARNVSLAHEKIGDGMAAQGDWNAALVEYEKALALTRELAAGDPANVGWVGDILEVESIVAEAHVSAGQLAEARAMFERALATATRLVAVSPDNRDWQTAREDIAKRLKTCCNSKRRRR